MVALVAVVVVSILISQLKYRSWPWQAPHRLAWCGMGWERGVQTSDGSLKLYGVGRNPPVIGPEFYSPYSSDRRHQLSSGAMGEACGGQLLARDGDQLVRYEVDPATPH